jgi:DNA-binding transcriptional ArsR family regulator
MRSLHAGVSQPAVSRHLAVLKLAVLKLAGLVRD